MIRLQRGWRRRSFSLIEILAALALGLLVVSITGQMALQGLETRQTVMRSMDESRREAIVFEALAEDFSNLLFTEKEAPLAVFGAPQQTLQLHVLTALEPEDSSLHVPRRPAMVRYRLWKTPGSQFSDLVRETIEQTTPNAPATREVIAPRVSLFELQVLTQEEWVGQWPGSSGKQTARAVRVRLKWADGKIAEPRTFLIRPPGGGV